MSDESKEALRAAKRAAAAARKEAARKAAKAKSDARREAGERMPASPVKVVSVGGGLAGLSTSAKIVLALGAGLVGYLAWKYYKSKR